MCVGLIKHSLYPKNPAQHSTDFKMLTELDPAFTNFETNQKKLITCIRVDGASDEGPSHQEVQFWWTEYHLTQGNYITLVSTRSSGSSYLNRVELQNGCLTKAHSNLFIPSTLSGSCNDEETGTIDQGRLRENLELATDVYINRCDGCPCGDTVIHLFRGADSTKAQELRPLLNIFLKGSQSKKRLLKTQHPEEFAFFSTVWSMRNQHLVSEMPETYVFYLRCCLQQECVHPLCQKKPKDPSTYIPSTWYPGGPPVSYIPLPFMDVSRPWGSTDCLECGGFCNRHYLKPEDLAGNQSIDASVPPSVKIQIWLNHLDEVSKNRQRGAAKAAETRRARRTAKEPINQQRPSNPHEETTKKAAKKSGEDNSKTEDQTYCGVCNGPYKSVTEEVQDWICCDHCETWFHYTCARINTSAEPESFLANTANLLLCQLSCPQGICQGFVGGLSNIIALG